MDNQDIIEQSVFSVNLLDNSDQSLISLKNLKVKLIVLFKIRQVKKLIIIHKHWNQVPEQVWKICLVKIC